MSDNAVKVAAEELKKWLDVLQQLIKEKQAQDAKMAAKLEKLQAKELAETRHQQMMDKFDKLANNGGEVSELKKAIEEAQKEIQSLRQQREDLGKKEAEELDEGVEQNLNEKPEVKNKDLAKEEEIEVEEEKQVEKQNVKAKEANHSMAKKEADEHNENQELKLAGEPGGQALDKTATTWKTGIAADINKNGVNWGGPKSSHDYKSQIKINQNAKVNIGFARK